MPKRKAEGGYAGENTKARVMYNNTRYVRSASSYRKARTRSLYRTGGRYAGAANGRRSALSMAAMESKNVDVQLPPATVFPASTLTGVVTHLNTVAQGPGATERIGRKIIMKSLLMRIALAKSPSQAGEGLCRILVVYDSQSNAVAPVATDILTLDAIHAPMNLNNSDRFKVIVDKLFPLGAVDNTAAWKVIYKKIKLETKYNTNTGGTIAAIQTGGLFALTYNINITTATASGSIYSRIRFYD